MRNVRPPAVAGMFYPADPATLRREVTGHLDAATPRGPGSARVKAVIAPHAGYVYSGPTAGFAFSQLAADAAVIRRIVLLGPAHRVALGGIGLPGCDGFATPLGEVPVAEEAARRIAGLPRVSTSPTAHEAEHSLEVELPFLQQQLDEFELLPLVVGDARGEEVAAVLEAVWGGPETRIVISSDLSHYLPYERARAVDSETARAIVALEAPLERGRACGALPIDGLLVTARRRGLTARLLDLRNSGDTAGDRHRVVGYGAFDFLEAA
jgi:AmmeMemoRadiSam system protein B